MEYEEGLGGRGHRYTNGWFMFMYVRNQCNIVKQLFSRLKIDKLKKLQNTLTGIIWFQTLSSHTPLSKYKHIILPFLSFTPVNTSG